MNSFDEMTRMFREMNEMFERMHHSWWSEWDEDAATATRRPGLESGAGTELESGNRLESATGAALEPTFQSAFAGRPGGAAAATLEDEGDEYVFVMDLPGFEREDVDLTFENGLLSVRAVRDDEEGSDRMRAMRSRRVSEQVRIPTEVVVDEISASYRNGVLEVHLPVVEDERGDSGHRIDID